MLRCLDNCVGLAKYAGPGQWNDPDMLEVGNGGMTTNEYKSHFALWALLKSPLLIGCDITNMSADTRNILLSNEVIALSQDILGVAGDLIWKEGPNEVYAMPLSDGSRGVVLFNRYESIIPSLLFSLQFVTKAA
jgi:alpha-galactosidase